jgi:hypothetical protein
MTHIIVLEECIDYQSTKRRITLRMRMKRTRTKYLYTPINLIDSTKIELHGFSTQKKMVNFIFTTIQILFLKAQLDQNILSSLSWLL